METLARQKEDERWRTGLQESLHADRRAVMEEFAAPNFVERVTESRPSDNDNDIRTISMMMQGVRKWCQRQCLLYLSLRLGLGGTPNRVRRRTQADGEEPV